MRYDDLTVGQSAEYSKMISDEDVKSFAQVTGDFNPVHIDEEAAAKTRFGGTHRPRNVERRGSCPPRSPTSCLGQGSIYLAQTMRFTAPVRIGDTVTVSLTVLELLSKKRVRLATVCRNQNGETVLDGEATILVDES